MKIHLRFNKDSEVHSEASLFIDGENSGVIIASPAQMIWLNHILEKGCAALSPEGRAKIEFVASGTPPQATAEEIDREVGHANG